MHIFRRKVIAGFYASYGKKVVAFHSDRESNFSATTFEMLKQGIRLIQTAAGVHERTAERYIKGIRDGVKATLEQIRKEYELPVMFYPLLVESIIASYNLAPNYKTGNEVPFGMLSGMKVDGRYLKHGFGSTGYFYNPYHSTYKSGVFGIVVGHERESGAILAFNVQTRQYAHYSKFIPAPLNEEEKRAIDGLWNGQSIPLNDMIDSGDWKKIKETLVKTRFLPKTLVKTRHRPW